MSTDTLPAEVEAEEWFLSCAMIDAPNVISDGLALGLSAESFYDSRHAAVFTAFLRLIANGVFCDPAAIWCELKDMGEAERVGGLPFLLQVSHAMPTTAYSKYFAKRIRDAELRRRLIRANASITEDAKNPDGSPASQVLQNAAAAIMAIDERQEREDWRVAVATAESDLECRLDPRRQAEASADLLSFGFSDVDLRLGKMRNGQVIVLAARPSVGKSSLARQIALHVATNVREQVIFASLEVTGKTLAWNLAQTVCGVSAASITPTVHPADAKQFRNALKSVMSSKLDVLAASNISVASIRARAEVLRVKGSPVRLVVIDYLQLMPDCAPGKGETRAASVGRVSRALKAFALAENCVVLVLSQLNRDSAKDGREPQLHDLRESGDIEQDADKVILLHRPADNPMTKQSQPETSLPADVPSFYINAIQAKGRDDGTGIVGLNFRRAITRFEQFARAPSLTTTNSQYHD